jgi:hypothetical protein
MVTVVTSDKRNIFTFNDVKSTTNIPQNIKGTLSAQLYISD